MKSERLLKSIAVLILAVVMHAGGGRGIVSGQETASREDSEKEAPGIARRLTIVGVWHNWITRVDCDTGEPLASFQGLFTYHKGGTSSETAGGPPGPTRRSPGHGIWKRTGNRTFGSKFMYLRYNADGTLAGSQRITTQLRLDQNGNRTDNTVAIEVLDIDGNVISTGCATTVGFRLE